MTTNSESSMRLTDSFRPYREQIRFNLGQLDNDWAYQLWFVPDTAGWPDAPGYSDFDWNSRYIQAGGSADRMSVEMQRVENGELRHYVVGRPHDLDEPLTETVNVAGTDHPCTLPRCSTPMRPRTSSSTTSVTAARCPTATCCGTSTSRRAALKRSGGASSAATGAGLVAHAHVAHGLVLVHEAELGRW
uniref:Uncharacterized protein n=1 Tax=Neobacillus citreus TaxID=2833578 RepID=A0A942Y9M9_9BACI